jgi:hypothetical protein
VTEKPGEIPLDIYPGEHGVHLIREDYPTNTVLHLIHTHLLIYTFRVNSSFQMSVLPELTWLVRRLLSISAGNIELPFIHAFLQHIWQ